MPARCGARHTTPSVTRVPPPTPLGEPTHGSRPRAGRGRRAHRRRDHRLEDAPLPRPAAGGAGRRLRLPPPAGRHPGHGDRRVRLDPRRDRHRHRAGHRDRSDPRAHRCRRDDGRDRDPVARAAVPDTDDLGDRLHRVDPGVLRLRLRHLELAQGVAGPPHPDLHGRDVGRPGHRPLRHPHPRAPSSVPSSGCCGPTGSRMPSPTAREPRSWRPPPRSSSTSRSATGPSPARWLRWPRSSSPSC